MTAVLTSVPDVSSWLAWFDRKGYCFDRLRVAGGQTLPHHGLVLGRKAIDPTGPLRITPAPTNRQFVGLVEAAGHPQGDVAAGAKPGDHRLVCERGGTAEARFTLLGPDGHALYTIGPEVQTREPLRFVVHIGGDAFTAGESWTLSATPSHGNLVPLGAPGALDGSGEFAGILHQPVDASEGGQPRNVGVLVRGPAEVKRSGLRWPSFYDTEAKRRPVFDAMLRAGIRVMQTA